MNRFLILLLAAALLPGDAFGAEIKVIELTDGSVLTGEVQSLNNGVYAIRTDSLGTVTVEDARIRSIRARGTRAPVADTAAQIQTVQKQLLTDTDVLSRIESLKDDPAFREALGDPELLRAVEAGDIAALSTNSRFLQLMNNPAVKDIQKKAAK